MVGWWDDKIVECYDKPSGDVHSRCVAEEDSADLGEHPREWQYNRRKPSVLPGHGLYPIEVARARLGSGKPLRSIW